MNWTIHTGRVEDILPTLEPQSFDGVLCDPPYGLNKVDTDRTIACLVSWIAGKPYRPGGGGFMSREWDAFVPGPEVWSLVNTVLKPGAHCLAFGGTRMWDFLSIALRLGGFEIRDTVAWMYGSGFPKSANVSKLLDKAAGAEREVVETIDRRSVIDGAKRTSVAGGNHDMRKNLSALVDITAPATPAAVQWDGYGSALKPAWEPVIVAMKPLDGTYTENALAYEVAGLNIDGSRVVATYEDEPTEWCECDD
jgi:site-specific DNA-methyltransferase (adenine-specific)